MNITMLSSAFAGIYVDGVFVENDRLEEKTWVCEHCGERHLNETECIEFDGEIWCEECIEEDTFECGYCGERHHIEDGLTVRVGRYDDEVWCEECADEYTVRCEECDERVSIEYAEEIDDYYGTWVCQQCLSDYYTRCDDCGRYVRDDEVTRVSNGDYVCDSCLEENYYYCEECGEYVYYLDWDDEAEMCTECAESRIEECETISVGGDVIENAGADDIVDSGTTIRSPNAVVRPYHCRPALNWIGRALPSWNGRMRGVGVELEVDGHNSRPSSEQRQRALNKIDRVAGNEVYFNADCSLRNNGFEIITLPHTVEAFYEMPWREIMAACSENGYSSHDAGTCGLHFHFSREMFGDDTETQDENISKMVQFFEFYWDDMVKVSRREASQLHWCNRKGYVSAKRIKDYVKRKYGGHDEAINNGNSATVEIRIMRGTLNYASFMACFDVCLALVTNSTRVDWSEVCESDEMLRGIKLETARYLLSRGAFCDTARKVEAGTL